MAEEPLPVAKALDDSPTDGITSLSYVDKSLLASASWDGTMRVHDTASFSLKLSQPLESGPLFCLDYDQNMLFAGGMNGMIRRLDINNPKSLLVGKHKSPDDLSKPACSCLKALGNGIIASAGWHRQLHLWDIRQQTPISTVELPGKAFSMDLDPKEQNLLAVATSGRRTCFFDLRRTDDDKVTNAELVLDRESSLKYQTRCLRFFPDGNAIAIASIEGRASVEYLDELGREAKGKKFAFKCHRVGDMVYPVNSIAFHPRFGTFATGGCDGTVVIWDGLNKKKISSLPAFPTSVAAMAFNYDGSELAIASSYTFEEGEREHPKDEIYVRKMLDSECAPKAKS